MIPARYPADPRLELCCDGAGRVANSGEQALKILIDEAEIREKVAELGRRITADYQQRPLTVLGVLKGSVVLMADLIRQIAVPHRVGVVHASSYRGRTTAADTLQIERPFPGELAGRDVLILDDIFDTGSTLAALLDAVRACHPQSVRTAVLLWKEGRQTVDVTPDYHGFKIPNEFVVGYGLDYAERYRDLPFVGLLKPEVYSS
jgi:hypoxanthine phosphoribosyltransferase